MSRPDICLSIGHVGYDEVMYHLKKVDLAEIRIDLLDLSESQLEKIFSKHDNLIATYRTEKSEYEKMYSVLLPAMESGCAYVDLDVDIPVIWREKIVKRAKGLKKKLIISYHNFVETPQTEKLDEYIEKMFHCGADIVKVACTANSSQDCSRMMSLNKKHKDLIAFSMGDLGVITRYAAPTMGAPFTYAAIPGKETAPGQADYYAIEEFLNKYLPLT